MFPNEHSELLVAAKAATENGKLHGANYILYKDEVRGVDNVNPLRQSMSDAMGSAIYDIRHPKHAKLGLSFPYELGYKLRKYTYKPFGQKQKVVMMIKGGFAAAIQMGRIMGPEAAIAAGFGFSDLDINVLVDPTLPKAEFDEIQTVMHVLVNQTMSVHKRRLDRTFFKIREGDREAHHFFDSDAEKEVFKALACSAVGIVDGAQSCLESDTIRNRGSNMSYLITSSDHPSVVNEGAMCRVKVEQPHLVKAECIPLGRTPFYITVNDTINGNRDNGDKVSFTLTRMKLSHIITKTDADWVKVSLRVGRSASASSAANAEEAEDAATSYSSNCNNSSSDEYVTVSIFQPYEKVSADFIDVWVGNQDDADLIEFERRGGFNGALTEKVTAFGCDMVLPTLAECTLDYYKLLHVFTCPESKKEKRERKHLALIKACEGVEERAKAEHMHMMQMQRQFWQQQQMQQQQQFWQQQQMQQQQSQSPHFRRDAGRNQDQYRCPVAQNSQNGNKSFSQPPPPPPPKQQTQQTL